MKISLNNDLGELRTAAEQIDAFCESHDVPADITYAVNLSVDELLTNTISYGYDDDEVHGLDLALRMDGDVMVIEITDDAKPYDPSQNTTPDTSAGIDERSIGGLGIFLVHELMDEVQYSRSGERNIVTLRKRANADDRSVVA